MHIINEKRCIIGEGPIWNHFEKRLYYTNGMANEICVFDVCNKKLDVLAITTASFGNDIEVDKNAGYTILLKTSTKGRLPYLFG